MRKNWRKLFTTAALAFMLCLTGLALSGEAQAQRFKDNGNGTVTDTVTGLMWTKDANPFGSLSWHDAMSRCSSFGIFGLGGSSSIGGWRLPSWDELRALYRAFQGGHPFTGIQSGPYWSSSTIEYNTDYAWTVYMSTEYKSYDNKTGINHVWPVRSGQ